MSFRTQTLTATAILALAAAGATPALAAGTLAGSTITNSASIAYNVNAIAQSAIASSDTVTVDRVITMTLEDVGNAATIVRPGQTGAALTVKLTNNSNATLDFNLDYFQHSGVASPHGHAQDSFQMTVGTNVFFEDTNTNGAYDAGTDKAIAYLDEVLPDTSRTYFFVADTPANVTNNTTAAVALSAIAREGATAGTLGTTITATTGANTAGVDTVFAEAASWSSGANNGIISYLDEYLVKTATLTVTRTSKILSNTIEASNFKAIPGAEVEFCVRVANATGAEPAANVVITESLPAHYAYNSTLGILQGGTVTTGTCNTDGTKGGTYTAGTAGAAHTVKGTIGALAAGETKTIVYRATVN